MCAGSQGEPSPHKYKVTLVPSSSLGPRGHQPALHPPGEGLILGEQGTPYDDFGELKTNPNPLPLTSAPCVVGGAGGPICRARQALYCSGSSEHWAHRQPPPFYVLGYLRADSLLEERQPEKQGPGSDVRLGFTRHVPCSTSSGPSRSQPLPPSHRGFGCTSQSKTNEIIHA